MSNLYIYEQGSTLNYKENRVIINYSKDDFKSIPIEHIDNIVLYGGIEITTPCIQQLLMRGIHLTWLSQNGKYFGRLESTSHININKQRLQFKKSDDVMFSLEIAKEFIRGKVTNQRIILLRGNKQLKSPKISSIIARIKMNLKKIDETKSIKELMGWEGLFAKLYFEGINYIIDEKYSFSKRTKRPPKDPFNSLLSFGYTLLYYEIFTMLTTKGLNPYAGFLHADKHKHASLCSDLMEEWRPILVDSLVIALLNNNRIKEKDFDFLENGKGVYLNRAAAKKFISNFEKRLKQKVSYIEEVPYKMSFRKIIEYQTMLLIKAMENSNPKLYKSILIR